MFAALREDEFVTRGLKSYYLRLSQPSSEHSIACTKYLPILLPLAPHITSMNHDMRTTCNQHGVRNTHVPMCSAPFPQYKTSHVTAL